MPNPVLRLVTPAAANAVAIRAFEDELKDLGWKSANLDYPGAYAANGDNTQLGTKAQLAVTEAQAAIKAGLRAVIVADGTMAATEVQTRTSTIPIILAAGGSVPNNRQNNLKGFLLNAEQTCYDQFDTLNNQGNTPVAVLYDFTNGPSGPLFQLLQNYAKINQVKGVDIKGDLNNLTVAQLQGVDPPNKGFMIIPNALFFNNHKTITDKVEQANLQAVIYPEREYKKGHNNKSGKKVHGHHIGITFRWAANYVDSILDGAAFSRFPDFLEAIKDED